MIVNLNDAKECWICGSTKKTTAHHALPKHLKPINNVVVPVCEVCHRKINFEDFRGMHSYITKISLTMSESLGGVKRIAKGIENLEKLRKGEVVTTTELK